MQRSASSSNAFVDASPRDERRDRALLLPEPCSNCRDVLIAVELRKACIDERLPTTHELRFVQVHRCGMEAMKERARNRREDRVPEQQSEQGRDERVLDVKHWPGLAREVRPHGLFHADVARTEFKMHTLDRAKFLRRDIDARASI